MLSPCQKCTERHPMCHGKCEKYAEFRKEVEKVAKRRNKAKFVSERSKK